jgi:hypothetical protein
MVATSVVGVLCCFFITLSVFHTSGMCQAPTLGRNPNIAKVNKQVNKTNFINPKLSPVVVQIIKPRNPGCTQYARNFACRATAAGLIDCRERLLIRPASGNVGVANEVSNFLVPGLADDEVRCKRRQRQRANTSTAVTNTEWPPGRIV